MMPTFLQIAFDWLTTAPAGLYLLTGLMATIWAASEVVVAYPERPTQALWTGGAWLLMMANALFACLVLGAALGLIPGSASFWMALGVELRSTSSPADRPTACARIGGWISCV